MYALSPNRSRNVVEKVESDWGNQRREYSSFQNYLQKKKEKKRKPFFQDWAFKRQGFRAKYYPNGWRFCEKTEGLDLDVKRPLTNFAIFFVNFGVSIPE